MSKSSVWRNIEQGKAEDGCKVGTCRILLDAVKCAISEYEGPSQDAEKKDNEKDEENMSPNEWLLMKKTNPLSQAFDIQATPTVSSG